MTEYDFFFGMDRQGAQFAEKGLAETLRLAREIERANKINFRMFMLFMGISASPMVITRLIPHEYLLAIIDWMISKHDPILDAIG